MDATVTFTLFFFIRLIVPLFLMLMLGTYFTSRWQAMVG